MENPGLAGTVAGADATVPVVEAVAVAAGAVGAAAVVVSPPESEGDGAAGAMLEAASVSPAPAIVVAAFCRADDSLRNWAMMAIPNTVAVTPRTIAAIVNPRVLPPDVAETGRWSERGAEPPVLR
jgi:hypothetical protein